MKLDRGLIKSQAKEIIKGKVLKLFVITFVVGLLVGGLSAGVSASTTVQNVQNLSSGSVVTPPSEFDMDNFDPDSFFEEYAAPDPAKPNVTFSFHSGILGLITLAMLPLTVTMAALFLMLIKGEDKSLAEGLTYLFKTAFDKNYFNRFLLVFLQGLFTFLWSLLFLIPGIVYGYKVYFAVYIMAENPELSWRQALETSKKMTNGHKGELFALDLSFIPWYLLCLITLGLAGIYFAPYRTTVQALYYQNFKQRALQEGVITELDFYSDAQKLAAGQPNAGYVPYQAPAQPSYQPYQAPAQPQQPSYQPYQAPAQPQQPTYQPYQAPVQPQQSAYEPQENTYTPQPAEPVIPAEPEMPSEPTIPPEPEIYPSASDFE